MDFELSDEQKLLKENLRRYLAQHYDFESRKRIVHSELGHAPEVWRGFAELGLLGLTLPAALGGLEGTAVDTMLVMEALGRALVVEPYLASIVIGAELVRRAGSELQQAELLPAVAEGRLRLALAHDEPGSRFELARVSSRARKDGAGYVLDGRKSMVLHGAQADQLLVSARTAGAPGDAQGVSLFLVPRGAAGLTVFAHETWDGQRAASLTFVNLRVPEQGRLGELGQALTHIERAREHGLQALCAEAIGAMDMLNELTVEYLKTRRQFGVQIGKFQALSHRMADMFMATEQARSMAIVAALKVDAEADAERRYMLAAAKALVGQAARTVAQGAVQLHGGMGVTEELVAAHYFKRLTAIDATLGTADQHLGVVSGLLQHGEEPSFF